MPDLNQITDLEVVRFLRANAPEALAERYAVLVKRHPAHPNLVMLKYNQIESPMGERIVQECRGIILDEASDWRIVSFPYTKFFNYGEEQAPVIDWPTARVYQKLDGSLMTLYWYAGQWRVASSGTPDAGGLAWGTTWTFAELFWRVWGMLGYALPEDTGCCYMFELLTPYNRIIVPQATERIVLHGVRDLSTLREREPEAVAGRYGWTCVESCPLGTMEDVLASCAIIDPKDSEGYVVRDAAFNRIKVKSPRYVALAHLKDSCSARRLLEIVRKNESAEFLSYFPEFRAAYEDIGRQFAALCDELEADYGWLKAIAAQKDFAAAALKTRCSGALFAIRGGKSRSVRDYFADCTIQQMERVLRLDESLLGDLSRGPE